MLIVAAGGNGHRRLRGPGRWCGRREEEGEENKEKETEEGKRNEGHSKLKGPVRQCGRRREEWEEMKEKETEGEKRRGRRTTGDSEGEADGAGEGKRNGKEKWEG